jgi:hypothetical protein
MVKKALLILLVFFNVHFAWAQKTEIIIKGTVTDFNGLAIEDAFIYTSDNKFFAYTDAKGQYNLVVKSDEAIAVFCSFATQNKRKVFNPQLATSFIWNVVFESAVDLKTHTVRPDLDRVVPGKIVLDPRKVERFPVVQFEQILKSVGLGVSQSAGELSSAYNVRGGNFDENLIYVNDIEIYRPFLVRSGQQEGLSFVNPDMVNNLQFSAGGWQAQFGDKIASVLDVEYRRPTSFGTRARLSLLGAEFQTENASKNERLTYMVGARYRTNQYLLGSLDVQGSYKPRFFDLQSLVTYRIKKGWQIEWLNNVASNRFLLSPESQTTSFGTVRDALRLYVGFGGQELMQYQNTVQALTLKFKPNSENEFKWITSYYVSNEIEHVTVEGAYFLDQLESNLGSASFSEPKLRLGQGYFINHARNNLLANVANTSIIGRHSHQLGTTKWGLKAQYENINDQLKEWRYNDSAGYRVPDNSSFDFDRYVNANNTFSSTRFIAYVQNTQFLNEAYNFRVNYGLRSNYWTFNNQNVVSPRIQMSFEPFKKFNDSLRQYNNSQLFDSLKKKDLQFTAAFGYYYQPPFYRELRDFDGLVNHNLKAQRSIHYVIGSDYNFEAWGRSFKWISEIYYKKMDNLVPYTLENVRIRYYAQNSSKGYATGFDTRINGEFIAGLESWFNFSILSTKENIVYTDEQGNTVNSGYIRRPTDQRVNFSILFQDELPMNPSYKMNLSLIYGSRVPYFLTGSARYLEGNTIPPYRRVDIGFSKSIIEEDKTKDKKIKSLWLSLEIFNMLQINNTISYIWIKDISNNTYGVPNYLTGRRINFKIFVKI